MYIFLKILCYTIIILYELWRWIIWCKWNSTLPTVMVGVSQRPRFIRVKVRVTSYSRPRKVSMGKKASLSVKRGAVAMETRSKDDGDVHVFLGPLQLAVGHGLEAQRCHALPHVEGSPNGVVGLAGAHFGCHVLYAAKTWNENPRG